MKNIILVILVFLGIMLSGCGDVYLLRTECMNGKVFSTVYHRSYIFNNHHKDWIVQPQYIILQGFANVKCTDKK